MDMFALAQGALDSGARCALFSAPFCAPRGFNCGFNCGFNWGFNWGFNCGSCHRVSRLSTVVLTFTQVQYGIGFRKLFPQAAARRVKLRSCTSNSSSLLWLDWPPGPQQRHTGVQQFTLPDHTVEAAQLQL